MVVFLYHVCICINQISNKVEPIMLKIVHIDSLSRTPAQANYYSASQSLSSTSHG